MHTLGGMHLPPLVMSLGQCSGRAMVPVPGLAAAFLLAPHWQHWPTHAHANFSFSYLESYARESRGYTMVVHCLVQIQNEICLIWNCLLNYILSWFVHWWWLLQLVCAECWVPGPHKALMISLLLYTMSTLPLKVLEFSSVAGNQWCLASGAAGGSSELGSRQQRTSWRLRSFLRPRVSFLRPAAPAARPWGSRHVLCWQSYNSCDLCPLVRARD